MSLANVAVKPGWIPMALLVACLIPIGQQRAVAGRERNEVAGREAAGPASASENRPWARSDSVRAASPAGKITVRGRITDASGEPLPGAEIMVSGTRTGISADPDGNYTLVFSKPGKDPVTLVYSYIGMVTHEEQVSTSTTLNVTMKADNALDAVVVNGFYSQQKETFTGSATTISGTDLVDIAPVNIIEGIAAYTPGMVIVEDNTQGSNPNRIPSVLIRGANTLITNESEEGVNNPLIMLDGVEISMSDLYDLDVYEIERVDVLKDASATILYGEKGANGVIVIERKRPDDAKLRLNYNFVPNFSIPDLSSFNLMDAAEKLEFEKLAGLYDSSNGSLDRAYDYKLQNVRAGVDPDWLHAPLRIPFSHSHSLSLSSRTSALEFRANAHFTDNYGVMKGDNRRNLSLAFNITYHKADKLTLSWRTSFAYTTSKDSPYGSYSQYSTMNPYNPIYDENGDYILRYYFDPYSTSFTSDYVVNPLYDATLSSFSKNKSHSMTNSLSGRWNISKYLYVTGQANLGMNWSSSDSYESPETAENLLVQDITLRGRYDFSNTERVSTDGKIVVNYGRSLDSKGSMFRISGGSNIEYQRANSKAAQAQGFLKDELSDLSFALHYPTNGQPSGTDNISTGAGFFANGNFSLWNRYFADLSYRSSGSSRFGAKNSFAPFWAFGAGWNLHNEKFIKDRLPWVNTLSLRYSIGYTGSVSFSYYQAKTVYRYQSDNQYYSGIGAVPRQMGNPDLKWQKTLNRNVGLTGAFWNNRINLSFDYYNNTTYDMLMPINLPPSVGTNSMNVNFGEISNAGIDLSLSGQIIRTKDWFWSVTLTGGHVMDKIRHISSSMKGVEVDNKDDAKKPKILFEEGGSQFDIYAMRSAGIDPATGREIYIKRNGDYTFTYDPDERVAVGNTNPALQGSLMTTLRWKNLSVTLNSTYTFGADYYNSTIQSKVEDVDPYKNLDKRALYDRWKSPGDHSRYLSIDSRETTHYSERFVEKRNELYISGIQFMYDFRPALLARVGMKKLAVGIGFTDIAHISTVKFERGTSYPYCRSFSLTFRPTF